MFTLHDVYVKFWAHFTLSFLCYTQNQCYPSLRENNACQLLVPFRGFCSYDYCLSLLQIRLQSLYSRTLALTSGSQNLTVSPPSHLITMLSITSCLFLQPYFPETLSRSHLKCVIICLYLEVIDLFWYNVPSLAS